MLEQLRILHLNVGKRREAHLGLLNDGSLRDFTALAIVEPYVYMDPGTGESTTYQDRHWQIFTPSERRPDGH
jgi:hypothetical protein